jgi:hypothetical protein
MPTTHRPSNRPEIGKQIAYKAHRDGGAQRCAEAAVHQTSAVDLALITSDDARRKDLALSLRKTAQPHDAPTLSLLPTVPGIGKMLRLGLRYEIHRSDRLPRGQAFASYARLVKCRQAAGGKRLGPAGKNIGHAPLTGACSAAAPLCLRNTPPGQTLLARLETKHAKGTALRMLAHTRGRAVDCRLQRQVAFDMAIFLQTSGSRAGEPRAALDAEGMSL